MTIKRAAMMIIAPNSYARKKGGGEEEVWRNLKGGGGGLLTTGKMGRPSQHDVAPCNKVGCVREGRTSGSVRT